MKIIEICGPYLYSVKYETEEIEFYKLFHEWENADWLQSFFETHSCDMDPVFWGNITDPEVASSRTLEEAFDLDSLFQQLLENTRNNTEPDLDTFFKPLGGEYAYVWDYLPVKGYGTAFPSLLRLYAIRLAPNSYIVTGGGIKYCRKMDDSPELKDELKKIEQVRRYLKENAIFDSEDI